MTRDAQLVLALLRTLDDWLPSLPVSIRRQQTGETPSATSLCPACAGKGHTGKQRRTCARCDGRGALVVDAYTEREVSTTERTVSRSHPVRCDACGGDGVHRNGKRCAHCDGTGNRLEQERSEGELERLEALQRIRAGHEAAGDVAFLERKARHYRQGSYAELEAALHRLERSHPALHSAVVHCVVFDEPRAPSETLRAQIDGACELLAAWLAKPVRCPTWALERRGAHGKGRWANGSAQAQRNAEIRRMRSEGLSLQKIGERVGLSRQSVQGVLRKA